jgi:hypothetical protein
LTEGGDTGQQAGGRSPFWRAVVRYGIAVVILVFYVTVYLHFDYTPDDTYIYLQYAKHIAHGDGFSFNAGSPSYGITGPLWALLIAGGTGLGLDPYIVAKTLDIVFASMTLLALYALAIYLLHDRIYALVATWIFSFDAWFLRWSASGMESSLAILLVLIAVWYAYRKEYVVSSFVAAVLTLVRPEGALLFAVVLLDNLFNTRDRRVARRAFLFSLLTYGAIVSVWLVYAYFSFGSVLPNTLQAKSTSGMSLPVLWFTGSSIAKILGATQVLSALLLILGVVVTVRAYSWRMLFEESFPLLWVVLLPLFYIILNVQVTSRYLLLILPFVAVYGVWGIKRLEVASLLSPQRALVALLVVAGLSLAENQYVYHEKVVPHMENFTEGMNECLKPMAYWLKSNAPEGATVLTPDIGMLGYVSGRKVYETAGLVTPAMKRAFRGVTYDEGMIEHRYERVIEPDYIVDRSPSPARLAADSLQPVMTRTFFGLGLTKPEPVYYTLYKVLK